MSRPPPPSPLFPYTTLFRSVRRARDVAEAGLGVGTGAGVGHRRATERRQRVRARRDSEEDEAQRGEGGEGGDPARSEEHTSELQSHVNLVCRLLLEKKKKYT